MSSRGRGLAQSNRRIGQRKCEERLEKRLQPHSDLVTNNDVDLKNTSITTSKSNKTTVETNQWRLWGVEPFHLPPIDERLLDSIVASRCDQLPDGNLNQSRIEVQEEKNNNNNSNSVHIAVERNKKKDLRINASIVNVNIPENDALEITHDFLCQHIRASSPPTPYYESETLSENNEISNGSKSSSSSKRRKLNSSEFDHSIL